MADRNHKLSEQIVKALGDLVMEQEAAVKVLQHHFRNHLIVNAGGVDKVAAFAQILRLRITLDECNLVLDYLEEMGLVGITLDQVESVINERLGEDRFIEP